MKSWGPPPLRQSSRRSMTGVGVGAIVAVAAIIAVGLGVGLYVGAGRAVGVVIGAAGELLPAGRVGFGATPVAVADTGKGA